MSEVIDGQKVRKGLEVKASDFLLISVGELSERKNQIVVLKALDKIKRSQPEFGLCFCNAEGVAERRKLSCLQYLKSEFDN